VLVPPDVPVVTFGPGDAGLLKPGAAVFVGVQKAADGSLTAARRDGGEGWGESRDVTGAPER